jgi:hypothetical protein
VMRMWTVLLAERCWTIEPVLAHAASSVTQGGPCLQPNVEPASGVVVSHIERRRAGGKHFSAKRCGDRGNGLPTR